MKVRIIVGAQAAYACIQTAQCSMDVRLNGGKSAVKSLSEHAQELEQKAKRLQKDAALVREAIQVLESQGKPCALNNVEYETAEMKNLALSLEGVS
jgi:hypothetical protein